MQPTPLNGLPFELVLRAQVRFASVDFLRRRAFREELALLDRFLAHLGIADPAAIESARRQRCLASWIRGARSDYAKLSPVRLSAWLPLASDLEATLRGGALLVATHFGGGLLTPLALAQLGIPMLAIVSTPGRPAQYPPLVEIVDISRQSRLGAVARAHATLRQGGVVFLAGDIASGSRDGDIDVSVLGRRRRISRGFAELSLATSVPPTPVFSRVDPAGNVFTWVEPALGGSGETHKERVAGLARSYARQVSEVFARHPGNVAPPTMRSFFASPPFRTDEA